MRRRATRRPRASLKLPAGIDERTAASMMVRGMTARYLLHATYKVKPGDTIVIHAAAGGVGLIVSQWAKHLGATVIGTVGSDDKAAVAKRARLRPRVLATTISPRRCASSPAARACRWSTTRSASTTFESSLQVPARRAASSPRSARPRAIPPPVSVRELGNMGSLFVTHPSLIDYTATRAELLETANDLFAMVGSGKIKIEINHSYPLREAAQAHRDVEARKTTGSVVLIP